MSATRPDLQARATSRAAGLPGVKHVIAVASGKGGVGKSTTSCNLALGFAAIGLKAGILDADIYGPSQPRLFGLQGKPRMVGPRMLEPMERFGVKVMSIGFLVEEDLAMIWRGAMVFRRSRKCCAKWPGANSMSRGDMPPGTGDRRSPWRKGHCRRGHRLDTAGHRANRCAARHPILKGEHPIGRSKTCQALVGLESRLYSNTAARQEAETRDSIPARYRSISDPRNIRRRAADRRD